MSTYLLDMFRYTVDREHDLTERYRKDPVGTVESWDGETADGFLPIPPSVPEPASGDDGPPRPEMSGNG